MEFIRENRNKSRIGTLLFLLSFLFSLQALSVKVEASITTSRETPTFSIISFDPLLRQITVYGVTVPDELSDPQSEIEFEFLGGG